MRSDDSPPTRLSDDERRRFAEITQSLDREPEPDTPSRFTPAAEAAWPLAGIVGLVAAIATLGVAPVIVPFAGFVMALLGFHQVSSRHLARGMPRRIGARLGLVAES